ncbi:MAG TPA: helix-hairpin-helix domain-containing protein [Gemmatimonas sp.]|uniref:helix-hairpin-helix domain-containing protein n=1 Tax=Gemmatimonas sp. TaxID=1962908 RepID=UPI002ED7DF73
MFRLSPRTLLRLLAVTAAAVATVISSTPSASAQAAKKQAPPAPGAKATSSASAAVTAATAAAPLIDINRASASELETVPGIGKAYAARIIAARPYANKAQLVQKGILTQGLYDKVKDRFIAKQ